MATNDSNADRLRRILAKDPEYERFKSVVKRFSMAEELETIMAEIETLHRTRKSRKLHSISPNPRDIVDASLEDSSFRSRAVEILMRMMRSKCAIERALDAVSGYIVTEYGDYIDSKTKAERERFIRVINTRALKYLDDLTSSIEIIREFISDLDKNSYSIKNAIEALSILYKRETVIHSA